MIKYALQCDQEHGFESWFPSGTSFDSQVKRGLVACPVCQSIRIGKQIMAPSVHMSSREGLDVAAAPQEDAPSADAPVTLLNETTEKLRAMLQEIHAHVQKNTEDVGVKFAEEARKIHYGEKQERAIRGRATMDEAAELHDEGIAFLPLPTLPQDRN